MPTSLHLAQSLILFLPLFFSLSLSHLSTSLSLLLLEHCFTLCLTCSFKLFKLTISPSCTLLFSCSSYTHTHTHQIYTHTHLSEGSYTHTQIMIAGLNIIPLTSQNNRRQSYRIHLFNDFVAVSLFPPREN